MVIIVLLNVFQNLVLKCSLAHPTSQSRLTSHFRRFTWCLSIGRGTTVGVDLSTPHPVRYTIFLGSHQHLSGRGWRREFSVEPFQVKSRCARAIVGMRMEYPGAET